MLKLKNIIKIYDVGTQEVEALRGIDVSFRKNEFVSILGPSGCGKTTLMNIIGGLDQYTSGDLIINGESTKDFKDTNWDNYRNKRIGFVFQSYNLIMHQTVLGNVELALTLSGISPSERKARATKVLQDVGLHDQLYKKPNQLSGGQMQRVAIARALVNEPEILLADEPTGALDTETSIQILELIKEVAKDRLVIMVTHNSDLAYQYSNRVINMLDGKFIDDSNPYTSKTKIKKITKEDKLKKTKKEKTSMSFFTALSLSFKNLLTKKWRTVLTAVAGSIGIIGVALILAVSSGTNKYVSKVESDTLSSNPLEIAEMFPNPEAVFEQMAQGSKLEKFPGANKVISQLDFDMAAAIGINKIDDNFESFMKMIQNDLDSNLYNDIIFSTGMEMEFFKKEEGKFVSLKAENQGFTPPGAPTPGDSFQLLPEQSFVDTQYDLLAGKYPEASNEIVLIVNEYNEVSITVLNQLGFNLDRDEFEVDTDGKPIMEKIDFKDIIYNEEKQTGPLLYTTSNDGKYKLDESGPNDKFVIKEVLDDVIELKITGVLRMNSQTTMGMLNKSIGYTKALRNELVKANLGINNEGDEINLSEITKFMDDNLALGKYIDPFTGEEYKSGLPFGPALKEEEKQALYNDDMRKLGGVDNFNNVKIYSKDFDSKETIKVELNNYNEKVYDAEEDYVVFFDMSELFSAIMGQIINIITIILVAFTSISLVVSSIMIGIITYVSVLERSKEIGILRSIGARKKDITRVFNAETFIIGLFSGMIGIVTTYLISFPANIIIKNLSDVDNIASLPILSAFILIIITVTLTVLAGLIPARGAAKKDPVEALRTE